MDKPKNTIRIECPQCGGTGQYMTESQARYPKEGEDVTCSHCRGTGVTIRHKDWISPYDKIIKRDTKDV